MKVLMISVFFSISLFSVKGQQVKSLPPVFEVAVQFGSMCCGPSSDIFLKEYFRKYLKKNCGKIPAYKIAGCGREGEFGVLFSLKKLSQKKKEKFISDLKDVVSRQELINKTQDSTAGRMMVETNVKTEDYTFCRLPAEKW